MYILTIGLPTMAEAFIALHDSRHNRSSVMPVRQSFAETLVNIGGNGDIVYGGDWGYLHFYFFTEMPHTVLNIFFGGEK